MSPWPSSCSAPCSPRMVRLSILEVTWNEMRVRSEERRVGKECRSRCDWSSDVCSSDLGHVEHVALAEQLFGALLAQNGAAVDLGGDLERDAGQIGRASCRERV